MPVVPFAPKTEARVPLPEPDPVFLAIAAGMMRKESQFTKSLKDYPTSSNIEDRRAQNFSDLTPPTSSDQTPAADIDSLRESQTPSPRSWVESNGELRYQRAKDIGSSSKNRK